MITNTTPMMVGIPEWVLNTTDPAYQETVRRIIIENLKKYRTVILTVKER